MAKNAVTKTWTLTAYDGVRYSDNVDPGGSEPEPEPEIGEYGSLRTYGTGSGGVDRAEADSIDCNIGDTDITIDFRIKCGSGNNASAITAGSGYLWITGNTIIDRDRYDQGRAFGISLTAGRITFGVKNGSGTSETWRCTTDLRDGEWHHIRIQRVLSTGAVAIWIDGTREVSDGSGPTGTISYPADADPNPEGEANDYKTVFGAEKHDVDAVTYPSFRGWLTEVLFKNNLMSSMSSSSITVPTARYTVDANTIALWHFDEDSGTTCVDAAGNANATMQVGGANNGPRRSTDSPWATVADIFSDDFEDRPTGAMLDSHFLQSVWASKGYEDPNVQDTTTILARASFPALLLSSPNLSSDKQRLIYATLTQEAHVRLPWRPPTPLPLDFWLSWWEFRPNNNYAAEKFMRFGTFLGNGNRDNDIIFGWGGEGVPRFNLFQQGPQPNFDTGTISPNLDLTGLHHYETRLVMSTGSSSDGIGELWMDGVRVLNATGLRFFNSTTRTIGVIDFGGWPSGQVGTGENQYPTYTYPISRGFLGLRVSSSRLGVWSLT